MSTFKYHWKCNSTLISNSDILQYSLYSAAAVTRTFVKYGTRYYPCDYSCTVNVLTE